MGEWASGRMGEWANGRMGEWANGRMGEWANGRMGEWANVAVSYIELQEEHHRTVTFEEEFRLFLKRYRVGFDERYVWD
jgi:hypothetical protein